MAFLPKSAARFAQTLTDDQFKSDRFDPRLLWSAWKNGGPKCFDSGSYGGYGGTLFTVEKTNGTGRATCANCGEKIKKGEATLVLTWQDSESGGYHCNTKRVHRSPCQPCKKLI